VRIRIDWNETPSILEGLMGNDSWILCDTCHEPIGPKRPGIAVTSAPSPLPAETEVTFVHKGKCDPNRDQWQDLGLFLKILLNGLQIEPR
jgi:hypothetical protein